MFAHIHTEQYQVVTDVMRKEPIGLNFIVGSGTTYLGKPPSFNVVHLDPDTMIPIDYESWVFDLVTANKENREVWYR
jgi:hypothetical protein